MIQDRADKFKKLYSLHPLKAEKIIDGLLRKHISLEIFDLLLGYLLGEYSFLRETNSLIKNVLFYKSRFINTTYTDEITGRISTGEYLGDPFKNILPLIYSKEFNSYKIYKKYIMEYQYILDNHKFINDPLSNPHLLRINRANIYIYMYIKLKRKIKVDIRSCVRTFSLVSHSSEIPPVNEFMKLIKNMEKVNLLDISTTTPFFLTRLGIDLLYYDYSKMDNESLLMKIASNYRDQLWIDKSLLDKVDYSGNIVNERIKILCNMYIQDLPKDFIPLRKIMNEYLAYLYINEY